MLSPRAVEVDDVRWAFWRRGPAEPQRALPDDVGLPTAPRPRAVSTPRDQDDPHEGASGRRPASPAEPPTSRQPTDGPSPIRESPLAAPAPDLDRAALAAAGPELAALVAGTAPPNTARTDDRTLSAAATAALAARLPTLSGVDGDLAFDEPAEELLHAYAELLATRAQDRRGADREDLLAVAHLAAAAAAVDAATEPALLLLAGVPADRQVRAAAALLAQTADDGGDPPDRLDAEVRALFAPPG